MDEEKLENVFFVAGPRKCATTSLFDALGALDAFQSSLYKEPQLFSFEPEIIRQNLNWYRSLFSSENTSELGGDVYLLDGSTWCYGSPTAAESISTFVKNPRVVFILRDPAKRVYSSFQHAFTHIPKYEYRDFEAILSEIESRRPTSLRDVTAIEQALLEEALAAGQIQGDVRARTPLDSGISAEFSAKTRAPYFEFKYFQESVYSDFIPEFQSTLGDNCLVLLFEQLIAKPESTLQRVLEFAGVETEGISVTLPESNRAEAPSGPIARKLLEWSDSGWFAPALRVTESLGLSAMTQSIPEKYLRTNPTALSESIYRRIRTLLEEEYAYWQKERPATEKLWTYE